MNALYGIKPGQRLGTTFQFREGSYSSFNSFDINFLNLPVYRADSKQEFVLDLAIFGFTFGTAGGVAATKFVLQKLESD